VLEGWDTAGKGGGLGGPHIVRRLDRALDPRSFKVRAIAAPNGRVRTWWKRLQPATPPGTWCPPTTNRTDAWLRFASSRIACPRALLLKPRALDPAVTEAASTLLGIRLSAEQPRAKLTRRHHFP
jgi:hypothetical protein